jgi:RNA polymerase sigma factor (sigma-70 family)
VARHQPATVEVLDVLARLPYRQRAAVVLRFWDDWPSADIAAALGCREVTVRVLVHRGLAALRHQLTPEEGP